MGTLNLPTQLAFPNHLRGPFLLRAPLERGRRKETGWGPCCYQEFLRPWHKGLGSRPPRGGGGGGEAAWPQCDLQRPPEKGTWPLPAQNCPSQCPQPWRGYEISDPFALWGPGGAEGIGGMLAEGNRGSGRDPWAWVSLRELQWQAVHLGSWKLLPDLGPGGKAGGLGCIAAGCGERGRQTLCLQSMQFCVLECHSAALDLPQRRAGGVGRWPRLETLWKGWEKASPVWCCQVGLSGAVRSAWSD